jgi:hypothetical protein
MLVVIVYYVNNIKCKKFDLEVFLSYVMLQAHGTCNTRLL